MDQIFGMDQYKNKLNPKNWGCRDVGFTLKRALQNSNFLTF